MYCADIEWKRVAKSMVRESSDRDDDEGFIVVYFGSERRGWVEDSGGSDSGEKLCCAVRVSGFKVALRSQKRRVPLADLTREGR
jgi:hypothetical protein